MRNSTATAHRWTAVFTVVGCAFAGAANAQQPTSPPPSNVVADYLYEPAGYLVEPDTITRAAIFADRHFRLGEENNGVYIDFANMIPGAGWLAVGPGYRRWYSKDQVLLDGSVATSWHGYTAGQARIELPKLVRSRLQLGAQVRLQDFTQVAFFGEGPDAALSNLSDYRLKSTDVVAYATVRPAPWLDVDGHIGWLSPSIQPTGGLFKRNVPTVEELFPDNTVFTHAVPSFTHTEIAVTADQRNYPGHPTRGTFVRGAVTGYADRDAALFSFRRYEAEAEQFVPLDRERVVIAVHGWVAASETDPGQVVPFYLEPSIGGQNSLRGYDEYRFHDRNLALVNVEARVAAVSHMDAAVFMDAGNVAYRFGDLNLAKRSYGIGVRFHTRRETFGRIDLARGAEGWRLFFRLTDPLNSIRHSRRTAAAPFVP